jgi:hypothetical protein
MPIQRSLTINKPKSPTLFQTFAEAIKGFYLLKDGAAVEHAPKGLSLQATQLKVGQSC